MRSDASAESGAGVASAARLGPRCAPDAAATRTSAMTRARPLAERRTGLAVEEVHAGDVDRDRDALGDAQHRVRRELGDEVRARRDDPLGARRHFSYFLVLSFADRERVDLEVHDRLAPERFHELDLRVE